MFPGAEEDARPAIAELCSVPVSAYSANRLPEWATALNCNCAAYTVLESGFSESQDSAGTDSP